jgi:hypothetical protein
VQDGDEEGDEERADERVAPNEGLRECRRPRLPNGYTVWKHKRERRRRGMTRESKTERVGDEESRRRRLPDGYTVRKCRRETRRETRREWHQTRDYESVEDQDFQTVIPFGSAGRSRGGS